MADHSKKDLLEQELAKIESELQVVMSDFDRIRNKGKELLTEAKGKIDEKKILDIQKRLGISD